MREFARIFSTGLFLISGVLCMALAASEIDTKKLAALKPRSIGPAAMSGRVTAIDVDPRNSDVVYAGTASGGLWKSNNGGVTWKPIFDDQGSASIGSVAVDPQNPDVIWVGTGEGNPRNSQSVGDGIYKSLDGGRSWQRLGLEKTEHLHRVLIHPKDSDTVYAAAVGATWGENAERGVFKTIDGGKSWTKVLYVDEKTGAADLVMDPSNPDKLIAAMWEHRRWPWAFKSGGPGSGVYVTFDGGENWKKRTADDGLPKGDLGRVGLGMSRSDPDRVYALVESKKNALYRSDDGGFKWSKINDKSEIGNRPFYYFDLRVDPNNANRIFSLHSSVTFSEDGGKSFKTLLPFRKAHADHHAFWIDPDNSDHMIDGNDGGLYITHDGGEDWRFVGNLPVGQFYHVRVDMDTPYNIYGGLQDNGTFAGPNRVWAGGFLGGGILNSHWQMVSFGDGFDVVPDPEDSRFGYSMSQGGNLLRYDRLTRDSRFIKPPHPEGKTLRFHWNAGIGIDPFQPRTIYYGSQYLHRSRDRGQSWEIISPDLTTDDPEKQKQLESGGLTYDVTNAENHTTIIAVAPSPVERGVIWVGTDDGNVQVTRDGGKNWTNTIANISGVPAHTWVPHIEASKFKGGEAFVVFDDHRRSNWTPYVYKTTDYGQTWTSLSSDSLRGFVYVIEQDPVAEDLLFLGTEFHLYFSVDGGGSWTKWDQGYPTVPTRDLVVHPRDPDLVIGTFGRAIWVMDDIGALRAMAIDGPEILDLPLKIFEMPPAIAANFGALNGELIGGDGRFSGKNRPRGALITYLVNPPTEDEPAEEVEVSGGNGASNDADQGEAKPKKPEKVKIEILDGDKVLRTLEGPAEAGLNRVTWRLDRKGARLPSRNRRARPGRQASGPEVLPGTYTVRVSYGEHQDTQPIEVKPDPRFPVSMEERKKRDEFITVMLGHVEAFNKSYQRLRDARKDVERIGELLEDRKDDKAKKAKEEGKAITKSLDSLIEQIFPKSVQGIRRDPSLISSRFRSTMGYVQSSWEAPSPAEKFALNQLEDDFKAFQKDADKIFDGAWKSYRKAVKNAKIELIKE